jgi:hypothetical protein
MTFCPKPLTSGNQAAILKKIALKSMYKVQHDFKEDSDNSSVDLSGIFDKLGEILERMKGASVEEKNRAKQDPSPPPPPTKKSGSKSK